MTYSVSSEMSRLVAMVKREQAPDGSWRYPFETGISTDAYMIILLRTLERNDEDLIRKLVERMESRQEDDGAWKLFYDEGEGNVTTTVEAYYALLYSGYRKKTDRHMASGEATDFRNGRHRKCAYAHEVYVGHDGTISLAEVFSDSR
ncbi:hypothetical protein PthBH41_22360 [Parageobacillus thermoglucosidasius]|nr:hypothetical protein PthBH41_22360 [Parageobacillus thermoglucosidasius]